MDRHEQQQQQPSFKNYYCRVCKRGFGCGRALGGHMRAHGIVGGDEVGNVDDDDPEPGGRHAYDLRNNSNRLKSCRACENCGKGFSSWKSFLEHGKCGSSEDVDEDVDEEVVLSPRSEDEVEGGWTGYGGWSKGKRSRKAVKAAGGSSGCTSREEEVLANCLVMLSASSTGQHDMRRAEPEESCELASKEVDRRRNILAAEIPDHKAKGMFECKACKKVFTSHQALGGHRASHKNVKGCFAAKPENDAVVEEEVIAHEDNDEDEFPIAAKSATGAPPPLNGDSSSILPVKRKHKVHECSICRRTFSSGQALGGHKRCHWITSGGPLDTSLAKIDHQLQDPFIQLQSTPNFINRSEQLDLNLPAPENVPPVAARQDSLAPLRLGVPSIPYLEHYCGPIQSRYKNIINDSIVDKETNHDSEAESSKIKLATLSELRGMEMGGDAAPWLRVGIGSTASAGSGEFMLEPH